METTLEDLLAIIGELTVKDRANTARIAALEAQLEEQAAAPGRIVDAARGD